MTIASDNDHANGEAQNDIAANAAATADQRAEETGERAGQDDSAPLNDEALEAEADDAPLDPQAQAAAAVINKHTAIAMALGLAPLPVFDVITMVGNQIKMTHSLAQIYGVPFQDKAARAIIISLIGGAAPTAAVTALSSGAKLIPGIGTLVGSGGVSLSGGALTYAVGRVFDKHFSTGGAMIDLDMSKARSVFKTELLKGRRAAEKVAEDVADAAAAPEAQPA